MRILITGIKGFVGSLAEPALTEGVEVARSVRQESRAEHISHPRCRPPLIEADRGDLWSRASVPTLSDRRNSWPRRPAQWLT